jgi:glycosyltransferase involved in cell wall biosynthesis
MKLNLSVVIPAYNEDQNLPLIAQAIIKQVETHKLGSFEIIFVDDGSTDNTAKTIIFLSKKYPSIRVFLFKKFLDIRRQFAQVWIMQWER